MKPDDNAVSRGSLGAHAILVVDDEPQACKWFSRLYGDEFVVFTAHGANDALALLAQRGEEVAVLLTDYAMPQRDGVSLLSEVRQRYPHVARLLVSAYADKDVAMSAVNQGHVEQILEKPLDEALTRQALREALNASLVRARERALVERRSATLRETLGFLAHEVTTPLATVQGYLTAMRERHRDTPHDGSGEARIQEQKPGDVLLMIEAAQRRAEYAQSLVSTFVQTARDAYQPDAAPNLRASDLVQAVRDEFPFDNDEARWLTSDLSDDFVLPGRRDLLYLVLCTLVKNALLALRAQPPAQPQVQIRLGREAPAPGLPEQAVIHVSDNGPGIAPEVLKRLTVEPTTTRAHASGSGMGLIFCRRVMTSLGGTILVRSDVGQGATVSLYFPFAQ
ncbi:hybrid sensor histidine kinase/response regulator [Hydrogenophaga sp. BPS33]|uniref:hybrid sensor histidine kinase/response regulator n=1 Tax=Hydrogenophaga sp. BPS33 TaxID=2651974 RepID=UPI00131F7BD6|nr:hybrid sensor histidine kinase/response regulator [Hydrogenophaga sp. BPS33]QHE84034.1 hybrid sensor histidine kinase/response regulator [Hydrogenophaga sp. BPS33]